MQNYWEHGAGNLIGGSLMQLLTVAIVVLIVWAIWRRVRSM